MYKHFKWMCSCLTIITMLSLFVFSSVKAEEIITVSPTNSGDDTKVIQQALNKAKEGSSITVKLSAGKYYISEVLSIYSNTKLSLDKNAVIARKNDKKIMLMSDTSNNKGGYEQSQNIIVEGGTWDGNVKNTTNLSHLMRFNHAKNVTLRNTTVKNFCDRHMVVFAGVDGIQVYNNQFLNAIDYTGSDPEKKYYTDELNDKVDKEQSKHTMEALHIDAIFSKSEPNAFPIDKTVCKNVLVQNNTFTNLKVALGSHYDFNGAGKKGENITIKNNTFNNVIYGAMNISTYKNVNISGNKINNSSQLARIVSSSGKVTNNQFNYKANPKQVKNDSFSSYGLYVSQSTLTIEGNNFSQSAAHGIFALNNANLTISKNNINKAGEYGIQIQKSKATIKSNSISNSRLYGVSSNSSTVSIENNTIKKATNGINIYGGSVKNINSNKLSSISANCINILKQAKVANIYKNTLSSPKKCGIEIQGKSKITNIKSNKITSPGAYGIGVYKQSSVSNIQSNTIDKAKKNGIQVDHASANVTSNTIKNSTKIAINFNSSNGNIKNNTCSQSKSNGIMILNRTGSKKKISVISGNKITSSKGHGIQIQKSSYINLLSNSVSSSKAHGILVMSSKNLNINKNKISKSNQNGISIGKSSKIVLNNNVSLKNKKFDISINGNTSGSGKQNTVQSKKKANVTNKKKFKLKSTKYKK